MMTAWLGGTASICSQHCKPCHAGTVYATIYLATVSNCVLLVVCTCIGSLVVLHYATAIGNLAGRLLTHAHLFVMSTPSLGFELLRAGVECSAVTCKW